MVPPPSQLAAGLVVPSQAGGAGSVASSTQKVPLSAYQLHMKYYAPNAEPQHLSKASAGDVPERPNARAKRENKMMMGGSAAAHVADDEEVAFEEAALLGGSRATDGEDESQKQAVSPPSAVPESPSSEWSVVQQPTSACGPKTYRLNQSSLTVLAAAFALGGANPAHGVPQADIATLLKADQTSDRKFGSWKGISAQANVDALVSRTLQGDAAEEAPVAADKKAKRLPLRTLVQEGLIKPVGADGLVRCTCDMKLLLQNVPEGGGQPRIEHLGEHHAECSRHHFVVGCISVNLVSTSKDSHAETLLEPLRGERGIEEFAAMCQCDMALAARRTAYAAHEGGVRLSIYGNPRDAPLQILAPSMQTRFAEVRGALAGRLQSIDTKYDQLRKSFGHESPQQPMADLRFYVMVPSNSDDGGLHGPTAEGYTPLLVEDARTVGEMPYKVHPAAGIKQPSYTLSLSACKVVDGVFSFAGYAEDDEKKQASAAAQSSDQGGDEKGADGLAQEDDDVEDIHGFSDTDSLAMVGPDSEADGVEAEVQQEEAEDVHVDGTRTEDENARPLCTVLVRPYGAAVKQTLRAAVGTELRSLPPFDGASEDEVFVYTFQLKEPVPEDALATCLACLSLEDADGDCVTDAMDGNTVVLGTAVRNGLGAFDKAILTDPANWVKKSACALFKEEIDELNAVVKQCIPTWDPTKGATQEQLACDPLAASCLRLLINQWYPHPERALDDCFNRCSMGMFFLRVEEQFQPVAVDKVSLRVERGGVRFNSLRGCYQEALAQLHRWDQLSLTEQIAMPHLLMYTPVGQSVPFVSTRVLPNEEAFTAKVQELKKASETWRVALTAANERFTNNVVKLKNSPFAELEGSDLLLPPMLAQRFRDVRAAVRHSLSASSRASLLVLDECAQTLS